MTNTSYAATARALYAQHVEKWDAEPRVIYKADWHRFMSAAENADDTSVEQGFDRDDDRWYEIWLSSYECSCDLGTYDDEYED